MALTWQNVSPSNPAGILQAGNMAAANIAKGLDTVGSSMQEYAEGAKDADTGKLLLMLDNAKDRNERQAILDNTDMDYIDQNIIAEENQKFEIGEERKAETLFNRGMQTDAAARDILAKKTTADFQQFQREDTAEKTKLQAENRVADVLTRDAQNERMHQTRVTAEKNKEAERTRLAEISKIKESRALNLDTQQRQINEIRLKELETEQENFATGKGLIGSHQQRLTEASASIPALTSYWTELDTKEIGGVKAAKALKEQVATQLYRQINRFDVFGDGVKISDKLRSVTEGTIQKNKANHRYNVKVFSDRLKNTLPGVINAEQLSSMSERMLNNVIMSEEGTYGDVASNLSKTADDLRQDKINIVKDKLFTAGEDKIIDQTEYTALDNYIKNASNFNNDTRPVRAELRTILETAVDKQFKDTQLLTDDPANYINALRKGAMGEGGLLNKNKVKTNNNELVQKLINAEMKRANSFGISKEKVKAKIEESLSNIPEYKTELAKAGVSWADQLADDKAFENINARKLGNSAETPAEINKAYKYFTDKQIPVPENLINKINTSVKDNALKIIEKNKLSTEGGVEFVEGKKVFNYDEYNTWYIKVRDAIKKEYPGVPDATLGSEIGKIVGNNPFLKKSLDAHMRTTAQVEKLTQLADRIELERAEVETNKLQKFKDNPVGYISDYISTSTGMKGILTHLGKSTDSAERDDFVKTVDNIQQVSQKIYNQLKSIYKKDNEYELMQKAERTFSRLEINVPDFWGNKVSFSSPSDDEILREARGSGSNSLNALDAAAIKRLEDQRDRTAIPSVKIQLTKRIEKLRAGN